MFSVLIEILFKVSLIFSPDHNALKPVWGSEHQRAFDCNDKQI